MSAPILLLRLHTVVVLVTGLFFSYKLLLLLRGRPEELRHLRARTRWADGVLLSATLLTGVGTWAATASAGLGFLVVLLSLVALLLVCVRALRQATTFLAFGSLVAAVAVYGAGLYVLQAQEQLTGPQAPAASSQGRAEATATPDAAAPVDTATISATDIATINSARLATEDGAEAAPAVLTAGKVLYTQNCAVCHGADGRLGLGGARDLTKSNLNEAGRVYQVTHGSISKKMPAFQGQLTEEQIRQVVAYSLTLR